MLVVALIVLRIAGVWQYYHFPAASMSPAIKPGDYVLATRLNAKTTPPARGTIVVFCPPVITGKRDKNSYTNRVAGLPGETIAIHNGRVVVNGTPVPIYNASGEIRYENLGGPFSKNGSLVVPRDHCFVLGDNSANSYDSRFWGTLPLSAVTGRVRYCLAPSAHRGPVH